MTIELADNILEKTGLSEADLRLRIAISLFQEEKLTLGQAAKLARLHQFEFQKELSARDIPIHYGFEELERDLQYLQIQLA